jgi:hypothetical protein
VRTASGSKVRSILAFALDTDSSVVEYTIFSAACQSRAYCRVRRQVGLGCAVSRCAWSPEDHRLVHPSAVDCLVVGRVGLEPTTQGL